jgi:predicted alpha/beta-hydrolase family hydrolase
MAFLHAPGNDAVMARRVRIRLEGAADSISGLVDAPRAASAALVLAHGAGAGMEHPFMSAVAQGLADRGLAVLRFQFPFMERESRRPDGPAVAHAAIRAAVRFAAGRFGDLPLYAGGKSFGGRMTSQAQSQNPLPGVRGLFFLGFPLHPAGKTSTQRAAHLADVRIPMLIVQGTRDALGSTRSLQRVITHLKLAARLHPVSQADHAFHVPARSGRTDQAVLEDVIDVLAQWITGPPKRAARSRRVTPSI